MIRKKQGRIEINYMTMGLIIGKRSSQTECPGNTGLEQTQYSIPVPSCFWFLMTSTEISI